MVNKYNVFNLEHRSTGLTVLFFLALVFSTTPSVFAGNVDNQNNYSAEWVRSLNRNAATDSADTVVYNPAGSVKMANGLYLSVTGQYAHKDYWHEVSGVTYDSDTPSYIPGVFGLYKKDRWTAFAAYTIICGGGKVEYNNGSATTLAIAQLLGLGNVRQYMKADSYYHALTFGGAYAINGNVSVSLGIRYVDAEIKKKGYAIPFYLDYEETGHGWGAILGLNLSPAKDLNIGFRYETKTSLSLETEVNRDDLGLLTDGAKRKRDLPALIGFGISYGITPDFRVEADLTYYLNRNADWDDIALSPFSDESEKGNGYDLGIAFEYAFSPEIKASMGYMFTDTGLDPDNMCAEAPELNAHTIAGGMACEIVPDLDINFGIAKVFYVDEKTSFGIDLNKKIYLLAVGIQYKF